MKSFSDTVAVLFVLGFIFAPSFDRWHRKQFPQPDLREYYRSINLQERIDSYNHK